MSFGSEIATGAGMRDFGCLFVIIAILVAIILGLVTYMSSI